jgi:hypothetical protein
MDRRMSSVAAGPGEKIGLSDQFLKTSVGANSRLGSG